MSVVVEMEGKTRLISKGAPEEIYKRCTKYELDGEIMDMEYLILADLKERVRAPVARTGSGCSRWRTRT